MIHRRSEINNNQEVELFKRSGWRVDLWKGSLVHPSHIPDHARQLLPRCLPCLFFGDGSMLSVIVTWKANCYNTAEVKMLNKVSQGREHLRLLNEQELIIEYKERAWYGCGPAHSGLNRYECHFWSTFRVHSGWLQGSGPLYIQPRCVVGTFTPQFCIVLL